MTFFDSQNDLIVKLSRQLRTILDDKHQPNVEAIDGRTLDECREDILLEPERVPEARDRVVQPHLITYRLDSLLCYLICTGFNRPIQFPICFMDTSCCLFVTTTSQCQPRD